jgi:Na+/phosphate symporter
MNQNDNPFSPPVMSGPAFDGPGLVPERDAYLPQIPVVGVLMIVQGALEVLYSVFCLGVGFVLLFGQMPRQENELPPEFLGMGMVIFGVVVVLLALLRIVSGVWVFRHRRRILALVTNGLGLAAMLTCYCAPSAIAICIYSFIILFQPSVVAAFAQHDT